MKATVDIKDTANNRIESRRLEVLWWRPSTDRKSVVRPRGRVPKRGRPSSRSATHQSCVANRASTHLLQNADALPRAGRPHVEPPDVYSCPSQERGYSARGAREGESKEGGVFRTTTPVVEPSTKHAVWRRVPRLATVASGLAHRSAQHLTPLRGRPLQTEEAKEREGARKSVPTSELRARAINSPTPQPPSHTKR